MRFFSRRHAGLRLAEKLIAYKNMKHCIIVALPRGGVPVAFKIAEALMLPLDILPVRKIGAPDNPELAIGAITKDVQVFNDDVIKHYAISPDTIQLSVDAEQQELERRGKLYHGGQEPCDLTNRVVIIVDDGATTDANIKAAVAAIRKEKAARIIVALPVASDSVVRALRKVADEVICVAIPSVLSSVGESYMDFNQVEDKEVLELLEQADARKFAQCTRKKHAPPLPYLKSRLTAKVE